ncbi:sugar ABC transporter substrate-binding protein [Candidatus Poriferisodalis sp.]|uniref:sugar ABC transporter substrate-binding protein n=1 Tax=Candidatus Poriferisodalis sp. TaxID=3101277 RepID=UPI003AF6D5BD
MPNRPRINIPDFSDKRVADPILEELDARHMSRRDLLKLASAGVVAAASWPLLSACGGASTGGSTTTTTTPAAGSPTTTAIVAPKSGQVANIIRVEQAYFLDQDDGAKKAAKILGLDYAATSSNQDVLQHISLVEQFVTGGAKMIIQGNVDGSDLRPIVEACTANEAYLANMFVTDPWFTPFDAGEYYVWYLDLFESENLGRTTRIVLDAIGGEGTAIYVEGLTGASVATTRKATTLNVLENEFPNVELLAIQDGKWNPVDAQKAVEDMVAAVGMPDVILCDNDGEAAGAVAAVEGLGMTPGVDVLISGQDGNRDVLDMIEDGRVYVTGFHSPAYFGVAPVVRCFDALNGVKLSAPERQMGVAGAIPVLQDNVAQVKRRFIETDNFPFDPVLMSKVHHPDDWDPMHELRALVLEEHWAPFGEAIFEKPDGWGPPEYVRALEAGEMEQVTQMYADHYQIRMDDFDYEGVPVPE